MPIAKRLSVGVSEKRLIQPITLASNVYYFIVTEVVILLIFTQYSAQEYN